MRQRSLRHTIVCMVLIAAVIPALAVAYSLGHRLYHQSIASAEREVSLASQRIQERLENQLHLVAAQAYAFSKDPRLVLAVQSSLFGGNTVRRFREFSQSKPEIVGQFLFTADKFVMEVLPYDLIAVAKTRMGDMLTHIAAGVSQNPEINYYWAVVTDPRLAKHQNAATPATKLVREASREDMLLALFVPLYTRANSGFSQREFVGTFVLLVSPQVLLEQDHALLG
jgi:hypothetical protein